MFCIAMHILYKVKLGEKCPMSIPNVIKACVTSYFDGGNANQLNTGQMNNQQNRQMPPNQQMNPNQQMHQNQNQPHGQNPHMQQNQMNPNRQTSHGPSMGGKYIL